MDTKTWVIIILVTLLLICLILYIVGRSSRSNSYSTFEDSSIVEDILYAIVSIIDISSDNDYGD